MKRKMLFCGALMSLAGTVCADIVEDNTYGYKYTNNSTGIYSPGGAGSVGNQRYDLYIQNIAQGKPAQARTVNNNYPIAKAVDGDYSGINGVYNFYHADGSDINGWWKVNYADTATALDSVVIFDRPGFQYRLDGFQITVWDGDPDNGGTLVWDSGIQNTSQTLRKEYEIPDNVAGTWLKIANNVDGRKTSNAPLTLCEVMILNKENKAGTYGNVEGWVAPTFTSAADSTLQIDLDYSGSTPSYDVLDVAGSYTAGGTLDLNLVNSANIKDGELHIIKAGSYAGSFASLNVNDFDTVDAIVNTEKLNSQGKIHIYTNWVHWKETATDTNFADTANWSSAPADRYAMIGVYANSPKSGQLNSALSLAQLQVGYNPGASGTIDITEGGELTVSGMMRIGVAGTGVMTVSGGALNSTMNGGNDKQGLLIGEGSGSNGTLNITGGTVTTYGPQIGVYAGSTGTLNISGGEMNVRGGNNFRIGNLGTGTVNITGGTLTSDAGIYMADQSGTGTLNISDGTLNANNVISVGTRQAAYLNVSGGAVKAHQIIVAYGASTSSRGTVNQTGGTVTVTDSIRFGSMGSSASGTYNLSGGKLTAPTIVHGNTNTTAKFNISGTGEAVFSGAVAVPTTLSGGTLTAGSITNTLTHSDGALTPGGVGTYGTTTITGTYLSALGNIALGMPTSQVSLYQDGTRFFPSEAVDGNTGNFSHTDPSSGKNQWWQVMFSEDDMPIESVKLYNRNLNGTANRLVNNGCGFHFELYSGTLENPGEMIAKSETYTAETWTQGKELALDFAEDGNILRVVRDFADDYSPAESELVLSLAEVEVYANAAEIQMDLKSDASEFDKILIDGGSMDVSHTILDLTIDDLLSVAPGTEWELFTTANDGTLTGDFFSVTLNGMGLTDGWDFTDGILSFNGTSNQVPEPGTMVLLALGLGGLFLMRRKR